MIVVGCAATQPTADPIRIPTAVPSSAPTLTLAPILSPTPASNNTPLPALNPEAPSVDVVPVTTLNVELFYDQRWMRVRQSVELRNTTSDTWGEVVFSVPIHHLPDTFLLDAYSTVSRKRKVLLYEVVISQFMA